MSRYLIDEIDTSPRITVRTSARLVDGGGDARLEWVLIDDIHTGERERRRTQGLFLLLGAEPLSDWAPAALALDSRGYVLTGPDLPPELWPSDRAPDRLATSIPGVFAAGDVRAGSLKRVATATGEGAAAISLVHAHLAATDPGRVAVADPHPGPRPSRSHTHPDQRGPHTGDRPPHGGTPQP